MLGYLLCIVSNQRTHNNVSEAVSNFETVAQNTIHRMNCGEDMGKLLYPGSLSTVPKKKEEYLRNTEVELKKLIDFDCKQVNAHYITFVPIDNLKITFRLQTKNKLTIMSMRCPTLLLNELKRASPATEYLDLHIIQLSYENYGDPEQGRKDVSVCGRIVWPPHR